MAILASGIETTLIALSLCLGIALMIVASMMIRDSRTTGGLALFVMSAAYVLVGPLLLLVRLGFLPQHLESLLSWALLILILTWVLVDHRTGMRKAIESWSQVKSPGQRLRRVTISFLTWGILLNLVVLLAVKLMLVLLGG